MTHRVRVLLNGLTSNSVPSVHIEYLPVFAGGHEFRNRLETASSAMVGFHGIVCVATSDRWFVIAPELLLEYPTPFMNRLDLVNQPFSKASSFEHQSLDMRSE